jgi:hypothetical protein
MLNPIGFAQMPYFLGLKARFLWSRSFFSSLKAKPSLLISEEYFENRQKTYLFLFSKNIVI